MFKSRRTGPVRLTAAITCGSVLAGCVQTPKLRPIAGSESDPQANPKSISINEVVKRVKCEIFDSVKYRTNYDWFNKWTVQANLTLVVNDLSQVTPGLTFTQPLTLANIANRVSNFPRSASLGVGGQVSGNAFRTEIVSFSMSIKEIRDQFKNPQTTIAYNDCRPYGPIDLTGDLGLNEWVDSAFGPVDHGLLTQGYHAAPKGPGGGAGAASTGAAARAKPAFEAAAKNLSSWDKLLDAAEGMPEILKNDIRLIFDLFRVLEGFGELYAEFQTNTDKKVVNVDAVRETLETVRTLTQKIEARRASIKIDGKVLKELSEYIDYNRVYEMVDRFVASSAEKRLTEQKAISNKIHDAISNAERLIVKRIANAIQALQLICDCQINEDPNAPIPKFDKMLEILKCLKTIQSALQADLPKPPPPKDPPIDAISHQVQFILILNAGANPTWTLVHFKGPSPTSGTFASLSETNTHTLTIVMGPPGSPAAANALSQLTFSATLANQLLPQLLQTPPTVVVP
jgi:hypothetical protein